MLVNVIGFKPEIIEQLPEDYKRILKVAKEYGITTSEELEKILSERREKPLKQGKGQWIPELEPNVLFPKIQELEPDKIVTADLSGQVENLQAFCHEENMKNYDKSSDNSEKDLKELYVEPYIDKKTIGNWGERYVYNTLKKKYQEKGNLVETDYGFKVINNNHKDFEIIWLNIHQDKGKGCDFVIKKNEIEMEYIEVKTKTGDTEELIQVTGTQWEFARKLFDKNEGEKYLFYVVYLAGKEDAYIKTLRNPVKLWKEGKIYAHPVNFKL